MGYDGLCGRQLCDGLTDLPDGVHSSDLLRGENLVLPSSEMHSSRQLIHNERDRFRLSEAEEGRKHLEVSDERRHSSGGRDTEELTSTSILVEGQ